MSKSKNMLSELARDLESMQLYVKTHKVDSYVLILNSDNHQYFYTWNFEQSPNLMLANTEMLLFELKTKILKVLEDISISSDDEPITSKSRLN